MSAKQQIVDREVRRLEAKRALKADRARIAELVNRGREARTASPPLRRAS